MSDKIVLAGAGHGHLLFLQRLGDLISSGFEVTVISPDRFHYYSGMGPGLISGIYEPEQCRFDVKEMTERSGALFITDSVKYINPRSRTVKTEGEIDMPYDAVSFNTGSRMRIPMTNAENGIFDVKPIENMVKIREYIENNFKELPFKCTVMGGGFAGIECACSVKDLSRKNGSDADIVIIQSSSFLTGSDGRLRKKILRELSGNNIRVIENSEIESAEQGLIRLKDGSIIKSDISINATGISPSTVFRDSGLYVHTDGSLMVNKYLQSPDYPEIFGTGDCIYFKDSPLRKAGVYAVRQNGIILNNTLSFLKGEELSAFTPQMEYLKILNTGFKRGILFRPPFLFSGRIAFQIKDLIDRKFMKRFGNTQP